MACHTVKLCVAGSLPRCVGYVVVVHGVVPVVVEVVGACAEGVACREG